MNNFERLKSYKSEYEFADIIMGYMAHHQSTIFEKDGTTNSLDFLRWLQGNKNIFDEDRKDQNTR